MWTSWHSRFTASCVAAGAIRPRTAASRVLRAPAHQQRPEQLLSRKNRPLPRFPACSQGLPVDLLQDCRSRPARRPDAGSACRPGPEIAPPELNGEFTLAGGYRPWRRLCRRFPRNATIEHESLRNSAPVVDQLGAPRNNARIEKKNADTGSRQRSRARPGTPGTPHQGLHQPRRPLRQDRDFGGGCRGAPPGRTPHHHAHTPPSLRLRLRLTVLRSPAPCRPAPQAKAFRHRRHATRAS